MNDEAMRKLDWIMGRANRSPKGDYGVYNGFKHELEAMSLPSAEYQKAIQKLANVLRV